MLYAMTGGVLGLGAPAGLLLTRLRRDALSMRSVAEEIRSDRRDLRLFGDVDDRGVRGVWRCARPLRRSAGASRDDRSAHRPLQPTGVSRRIAPRARTDGSISGAALAAAHGSGRPEACQRSIRARGGRCGASIRGGGDAQRFARNRSGRPNRRRRVCRPRAADRRRRPPSFWPSGCVRSWRQLATVAAVDRTTISIGIASVSPSMHALPTVASLMAAADAALYAAKRAGGNRVSAGGSRIEAALEQELSRRRGI